MGVAENKSCNRKSVKLKETGRDNLGIDFYKKYNNVHFTQTLVNTSIIKLFLVK